jgi:hypothetical protein
MLSVSGSKPGDSRTAAQAFFRRTVPSKAVSKTSVFSTALLNTAKMQSNAATVQRLT